MQGLKKRISPAFRGVTIAQKKPFCGMELEAKSKIGHGPDALCARTPEHPCFSFEKFPSRRGAGILIVMPAVCRLTETQCGKVWNLHLPP